MAQFEIKWRAPEFEYRPKTVSWYWISIIVAAVIVGMAVWQKNFLFGFLVIVAEILVLVWANREPPLVEFTLNEKGVDIGGNKFHAWDEIENFSIDDYLETEWPNLYFQFRARLKTPLKTKLPKERMAEIQKTLQTILPQTKHDRSALETLEEFIGF
jgi:hypothetical protein